MLYGNYVKSGKIRLDKTLKDLGITDIGGLSDQELEADGGRSARRAVRRLSPGVVRRRRSGERATSQLAEARNVLPLQQLGLQRARHDFRAGDRAQHLRRARDRPRPADRHAGLPARPAEEGRRPHPVDAPRLSHVVLDARHGAHRLPDAARRQLGGPPDRAGRLGASHREGEHADCRDEPAALPRRAIGVRVPVVDLRRAAGHGPVRGRLHRRGRRRPVHHGAAEARSRRCAQDRFPRRQADRLAGAVPRACSTTSSPRTAGHPARSEGVCAGRLRPGREWIAAAATPRTQACRHAE